MTWATLWCLIAGALVIGEMFTGELTLISIALGFLAAAGVAALGAPLGAQAAALAVVSAVGWLLLAPLLRRYLQPPTTPDPVQQMIGTEAEVVEAIRPPALGKVKRDGVIWQAESDRPLEVGDRVMVAEVDGARLRVMGRAEFRPQRTLATPEAEAEGLRAQAIDETQRSS